MPSSMTQQILPALHLRQSADCPVLAEGQIVIHNYRIRVLGSLNASLLSVLSPNLAGLILFRLGILSKGLPNATRDKR